MYRFPTTFDGVAIDKQGGRGRKHPPRRFYSKILLNIHLYQFHPNTSETLALSLYP